MITCLNNYIGVLGIQGYQNPDSRYFINDLPGITTNQLEQISDQDEEYEPRLAFDDIYKRASRNLEDDIKSALKKYFIRYSYVGNQITGYYDEKDPTTPGANYNGWYFDFGYETKNLKINLTSFDLYLETQTNFTIYIFDFVTGQELDAISFEGTEGLYTYRIEKEYALYRYSKLFIGYDEQQVSTIKASDRTLEQPLSVRRGNISKSSSIVADNFNGAESGLILNYNLDCSVDNFVCQRLSIFRDAFLYKLGIEFCNERLYSDRINRYTLMDRDSALELKNNFIQEYDRYIENALRDIKIDDDGICFECSKAINYKMFTG